MSVSLFFPLFSTQEGKAMFTHPDHLPRPQLRNADKTCGFVSRHHFHFRQLTSTQLVKAIVHSTDESTEVKQVCVTYPR